MLPARDREVLMADLREESGTSGHGPIWRVVQALRIGGRYHAESYHDPDDRLGIVALLAIVIGLLWMVPLATSDSALIAQTYFSDPFGRAILRFWGASHVTSALAAGLVAGRLPMVAEHAAAARWHVALAGGATSLAWHGVSSGTLAAVLLICATWLADRGRRAGTNAPPAVHG
jgi:hypothetical protein